MNEIPSILRLGCFVAALLFASATESAVPGFPRQPNVLFFFADDVGQEVLGCYGGESYQTPNIDRLAEQGMRFRHVYSLPMCSPSRTCILTGRYPFRTGTSGPAGWGKIPADELTFGHHMQRAGYNTCLTGKWQLNLLRDNPQFPHQMGFDEYFVFGWHEGPKYHDPLIYDNGKANVHLGKFGPDLFADYTFDFMRRHRDQPFLAFYAMTLAHEISNDLRPPATPGPSGKYESYQELVELMDAKVGRVLAALDELRLRENTLVLFCTDNGTPRKFITDVALRPDQRPKIQYLSEPIVSIQDGNPVVGGKKLLTDAGTNVPLIASWPGKIDAGQVVDELIDFSDFLPTLVDLAGGKLPDDPVIDGQSFKPRLFGESYQPRSWVFSQWDQSAWVRDQRWKLYRDGRLFDVRSDRLEQYPIRPTERTANASAKAKQFATILDTLD